MKTNVLYYGDNLEILRNRDYFPDSSVDLIYLDPPFSSKRDYNLLFKESDQWSEAQVKAFSDSWHWGGAAENTYQDIILNGPSKVAKLIDAFCNGIGRNDVMAYLVMMTVRLLELHRVLKKTGSLYLHCDPTASHYLKLVLDQIFGPTNFRNEIVWTMRGIGRKRRIKKFPTDTQRLLHYKKSAEATFNEQRWIDRVPKRLRNGQLELPEGFSRDESGRVFWTSPRGDYTDKSVQQLRQQGRIYVTARGKVRVKYFAQEEADAVLIERAVTDSWIDIPDILRRGSERLGYPTQKPLALLERVIAASSNEGDIVLDSFCGCGTAVVAAQKLNRRWIGIDITHLAIAVMRSRLQDSFPGIQFEVIGEPADLSGARALAKQDPYQFQWWAVSLVKAFPLSPERKKGADAGIDGFIPFLDDHADKARRAVVQVKSGHVGLKDVKELEATAAKEAMGIFITLAPPTKKMQTQALAAGSYHSPLWDKDYPKIQILTIEELFQGKTVNMPPAKPPFPKAPKLSKGEKGEQLALGGN